MGSSAPTAVSLLVRELRELILDARLAPAHPLREEALAEEFGVNRHTVRAALQQLAAQRLVTFEPYRGARVRSFSDEDIAALMQYRTALEAEAVRLLAGGADGADGAGNADAPDRAGSADRAGGAGGSDRAGGAGSAGAAADPAAAQATDHDGAGLPAIPEAVVAANAHLRAVCAQHPDDHRAIEQAHASLHHALVAAAGSARITEAHAALESELLLFLNQLRPLLPADEMADQHDRLLAALVARGEPAIREHLAYSAAQLLSLRRGDGGRMGA